MTAIVPPVLLTSGTRRGPARVVILSRMAAPASR